METPGLGKGGSLTKSQQIPLFPYLQVPPISHLPAAQPPGPRSQSQQRSVTHQDTQASVQELALLQELLVFDVPKLWGKERPLCPRPGPGCPPHSIAHSQTPSPGGWILLPTSPTVRGDPTLGTQVALSLQTFICPSILVAS